MSSHHHQRRRRHVSKQGNGTKRSLSPVPPRPPPPHKGDNHHHHHQHLPKYGFFPTNSYVDRIDRVLSRPFFFFDAWNPHLDHVLLLPGTWMGLPAPTWGFASAALTYVHVYRRDFTSFKANSFLALIVLAPLILYSVIFAFSMVKGKPTEIYSPKGQLPVALAMWIAIWCIIDDHRGPGAFFAVAWSIAQATTHLLKVTAGRMRPTKSFNLSNVKREFKELRFMFAEGQTLIESFPSADAAGAGALAGTLYLMNVMWIWPALVAFTSMFSRLYFHAHHLLDVFAGLMIGLTSCAVLFRICGERLDTMNAREVFISAIVFVMVHVGSKKIKPVLPKEFKSKDKTRYQDF